ncbi:CpaD family pilus assembly protein [Hyphomonas sp. FCG-A18]|uniref:CpaD family pilus assembly protein n=1 Tax=Hyphomonas sp. FCG-A18 TaxID=3080019 RepID=UPI002B291F00|nr:CpaD family pilus assembly protein [Hyphomonas sp. FCG-A18]
MVRMTHTMVAVLGLTGLIAGCQSAKDPIIPTSYYEGTVLDRHDIGVTAQTEYLRVNLNPIDSQLRQTEIRKIKGFLARYNKSGHGPLIMSMPKNFANPQLAVQAAAEARDLAWKAGVEYSQIAGSAYDAGGVADAPLILAFKSYEAVAPDCPQLSNIDFADARSNNDLPTLGCAVRTNMAAMIADPADLFGERDLEAGDILRRSTQLEAWREGSQTGAQRSDEESGAVSSAIE